MRLIDADALNIRKYTRWFENVEDARQVERMIREAPTIALPPKALPPKALPPKAPLTLEELRKLDGEPVWVCNPEDVNWGHWALIRVDRFDIPEYNFCAYAVGIFWSFSDYGKTWLAYRRRPEEIT